MKSFLHYIAKDIIEKYGNDLSHIALVFPNKRAALFLNEELAQCSDKPVWAPNYLTISDLFRRYSSLTVGDPIKLVCELYKTYTEVTGKDETLDHFYDWGRLLISDFDDVDKNMADAKMVFSNIANIHEFDDISYLSEEQKDILKSFFGNFSDDHNSKLKELFLSLWNKLGEIYAGFRERLSKQHIAYEGMLYRAVVDEQTIKVEHDKYIFVGFNVLQRVEQHLFSFLKSEGVAEFYWDYDFHYVSRNNGNIPNEAGKYISQYIKTLGDSLSEELRGEAYDNFRKQKDISFVKAKTENIQARYVSSWLKENERYKDGKRTAIVMCAENLLQAIVHSIPDCVENVNVTTGYPLSQTPVASFVSQLLDMRIIGTRDDGGFRISFIRKVLSHPFATHLSEKSQELLQKLKEDRNMFPKYEDLAVDDNLSMLFKSCQGNEDILRWLLQILETIAPKNDSPLYSESVFNMYTIINRLTTLVESGDLTIDSITLQKLVKQLIATASIPFHGEPAIGIQIMGVLETRNLDFDHILLLSCNEGNMPKGIRDSSFIPYSIRKAYGLTTVDNKVAIYSYYFHRLIQRASDITIMYNTSTENGNRGEMSRFMLQLMVEGGHDIKRLALHASQSCTDNSNGGIEKTDAIMEKMYSYSKLSPTALNRYLRCQLQFYYNNIAGIREPDDDIEEQLSSRAFGNIFHNASEEIYKDVCGTGRMVTESLIENLAKKEHVQEVVDRMFQKEMFGEDTSRWKKINYNGMQLISREVIIRYVQRLLEIDKALAPFNILALEKDMFEEITIPAGNGKKTIKIGGRIDRLDMITDPDTGRRRIRVIDYKTGGTDIKSGISEVEEIFDPAMAGGTNHTDYYLQSMLYSLIARKCKELNPYGLPVSPALIFIQHAFSEQYDPTIYINKVKVIDVAEYEEDYRKGMQQLVEEIYNPGISFQSTANDKHCEYCAYKALCGK